MHGDAALARARFDVDLIERLQPENVFGLDLLRLA
jgi:hypothetical protein